MQDILTQLSQLRRPRILMRAARIGADDYDRGVHLRRLLQPVPHQHGAALYQLMEKEAEMNELRLNEDSGYVLLRHVDLLIAIVAEARALQALRQAA